MVYCNKLQKSDTRQCLYAGLMSVQHRPSIARMRGVYKEGTPTTLYQIQCDRFATRAHTDLINPLTAGNYYIYIYILNLLAH